LDVLDECEERYFEIFSVRKKLYEIEKKIKNEYDNEEMKNERKELYQ